MKSPITVDMIPESFLRLLHMIAAYEPPIIAHELQVCGTWATSMMPPIIAHQ